MQGSLAKQPSVNGRADSCRAPIDRSLLLHTPATKKCLAFNLLMPMQMGAMPLELEAFLQELAAAVARSSGEDGQQLQAQVLVLNLYLG